MTPSPDEHSRGWHVDPFGRFEYRYFNGVRWTADVASQGRRLVDDYGTTMPPPRRRPMPAGEEYRNERRRTEPPENSVNRAGT